MSEPVRAEESGRSQASVGQEIDQTDLEIPAFIRKKMM